MTQYNIAEIDLAQSGYNFSTLEPEYKPEIVRIVNNKFRAEMDHEVKLVFKCAECGQIYSVPRAAKEHLKSHIKERIRKDLELEESIWPTISLIGLKEYKHEKITKVTSDISFDTELNSNPDYKSR